MRSYLLTFFAFNTTCTRKRQPIYVWRRLYGDKERRAGFGLGRIRTRRRDHDCVRPSHLGGIGQSTIFQHERRQDF